MTHLVAERFSTRQRQGLGHHVLLEHYLGQVLFMSGKQSERLAKVEAALFENSNSALHICDIGILLAKLGRLDEAEDLFRMAADFTPPFFVFGLPHPGTTLIQQVLAQYPSIQAGGEMLAAGHAFKQNQRLISVLEERVSESELTADDFSILGEDYVAFARREGIKRTIFTDKVPSNYLLIGALSMALPRARFFVMKRDPMDSLFSNYRQNFARNQPATSHLDWLAHSDQNFLETKACWHDNFESRVRFVSYEDLVQNPENVLKPIFEFLEVSWDPVVLDHTQSTDQVGTASYAQGRKPFYTSSIGSWPRYQRHLSALIDGGQSCFDPPSRRNPNRWNK